MADGEWSDPRNFKQWGWLFKEIPENNDKTNHFFTYKILGNKPCEKSGRNCKSNPYCIWGLGEKNWKEDSEGDDDDESAAFRREGGYAGLQNLGATCYVNSLLQLWFHNQIFRQAILKWTPIDTGNEESVYKPVSPLEQLQVMFARMKISKRRVIDPTDFISSLLIKTGEEQDAHEFSKLVMSRIEELLKDYGDDQIRKLIAKSFNGKLEYETECMSCNNKTTRIHIFTELVLSVKKNLGESLDELLVDEVLSDKYICRLCDTKTFAKRRTELVTLPPVLNLQLVRFYYDRGDHRRKKVTQKMSFPEVLDMHARVHKKNSDNGDNSNFKYHLTAVLIHKGQTAYSGHYFAHIKDPRNGEWLKFNDEFVEPVSKGKGQRSKDEDSEDTEKKTTNPPIVTSTGAYMLVYTLDKYIKSPEPDPELHPYLNELVEREDTLFEEEVNKKKREKDFEVSEKIRRRKEVEWLYEFGKSKVSNGEGDSDAGDDEKVEEPKPKIARCDNEALNEGPCDSTKNGEQKSNGNSDPDLAYEKEMNLRFPIRPWVLSDNFNFVSVHWITQWLEPGNPVPPIENGMLACVHKKLAPPPPNPNPCLYRIIPAPIASSWYEMYKGGPKWNFGDMCYTCVTQQNRKLRKLAKLDEDSKKVAEMVKKCDSEYSSYVKAGKDIPQSFLDSKVFLTKENLKNWKKMAKRIIDEEKDAEDSLDASSDIDGSYNPDLFCNHGRLSQDAGNRKLIPIHAWKTIKKYFKDHTIHETAGELPCSDCDSTDKNSKIEEVVESEKEEPNNTEPVIFFGGKKVQPNPVGWLAGFVEAVKASYSEKPKKYKVRPSTTIQESKYMLCGDFKIGLRDQHLFYEGRKLNDSTKTTPECPAPTGANSLTKGDTAENDKVDEPVSSIETGFPGTPLASGNTIVETPSPAQDS